MPKQSAANGHQIDACEAADDVSHSMRVARLDDLDGIWQIERTVFGDDAWSRNLVEDELRASHRIYLVLVNARGAVCGYGGVRVSGGQADVQTIALAPTARGLGNGRRLMGALIDAAKADGAGELFLDVRSDNLIAQAMYRSFGFTQIAVRPRYYQPDGVDALVMWLQLVRS